MQAGEVHGLLVMLAPQAMTDASLVLIDYLRLLFFSPGGGINDRIE
jgi:hypothetical protein